MRLLIFTCMSLAGAALSAHAAPVPSPPRLSEELLVGRWAMDWGGQRGWIVFAPDGTYTARYFAEAESVWVGVWMVERERLVLIEYHVTPWGPVSSDPVRYECRFSMAQYPRIGGRCGSVEMALHTPRR